LTHEVPDPPPTTIARRDVLWATAAGATALAVYVRTLAPGLTSDIDTAMFQFIGRVLGVPHNPGYPLYVLITYAFSYVPVGSLAYRINLFSALCGGLTVSLTYAVARRLGCRRVVSVVAALALAFGPVFWSQAVIAEVYTLDAVITAGMVLGMIAWRQTRRAGWYFAAVALFAAGLGNHTTIVGFAPGMALYAVLTDRRFVLRGRTLAATAGVLAAGLLQYGFIILRSNQPDAYLESRATTLSELLRVMLAGQFSDRLFAFSWRTVLFDRVPWLVGGVLTPELTVPGLVLACAGVVWLLRFRIEEALLLLTGGAAVLTFALNYSVVDTPVFLIPVVLVLWIAAAVGAEWATRVAERFSSARVSTAAAALALLLPAWQVAHNFAPTDRSRDTSDAVHLDRLFEALPDRAALVSEDFTIDRMLMFKLLGDPAGRPQRLEVAPREVEGVRSRFADGVSVFAGGKSADLLRYQALNFSFAPLPLIDGPLDGFLSRIAHGTTVAVAVPARHAERFASSRGVSFGVIGGPDTLTVDASSRVVIVGWPGSRKKAVVTIGAVDARVGVAPSQHRKETTSDPAAIHAWSGAEEAAIRQGARDIVRTSEGAVMAIWGPDGRLLNTFVLQADDEFRVPIPTGPLSVYPLRGVWAGQEVRADEWTDVTASAHTGSVMLHVPPGETLVVYVGDDTRLAPRVIGRSSTRVSVDITSLGGASADVRARLAGDHVPSAGLDRDTHVYRIAAQASGARRGSVLLALGGIPVHASARVMPGHSSDRATVFSVDTRGLLRTPDGVSEVLLMARDHQAHLAGYGWSKVDWDVVGPYRWMTATEARVLLPIAMQGGRRIRVQALLAEQGAARSVQLRLNGTELGSQALRAGWNTYEWTVPAGAFREGTNEAEFVVDRLSEAGSVGDMPREVAVSELRVLGGSGRSPRIAP
jgi:hypothetical protein